MKYYKPEFKDMTIGLEYEEFSPITEKWYKHSYTPTHFVETIPTGGIKTNFQDKEIRVKVLDKTDIEECGFSTENGEDFIKQSEKGYFIHIKYMPFSTHIVLKIETSVYKDSIRTCVVHSIRVKNKSELIKLLNQLNIINSLKNAVIYIFDLKSV